MTLSNKFYYYISFYFRGQISGYWYRGDESPLSKVAMERETTKLARSASLATKELVRPEEIVYISLTQLIPEVALDRWPEDFKITLP